MRWIFTLWALPMVFIWGWYFLSINDMHFGYVLLTREGNELVFEIYGEMLGIDPTTIPALLAKACIVDTLFILVIWAFRRRRNIADWLKAMRGRYPGEAPSPST
jgi:hypothetical protein